MFEALEEIKKQCESCQKCALGQTRTKIVFSAGTPNHKIMLIGEAPGFNEDQTGEGEQGLPETEGEPTNPVNAEAPSGGEENVPEAA